MVRKQRKRISYVLPLAKSAGGHRLGVNGLVVDSLNSVLYSGGRDGVICAWDLNLDLNPFADQHDDESRQPLLGDTDRSTSISSAYPNRNASISSSYISNTDRNASVASSTSHPLPNASSPPTRFRQQVQAHTHWINDIVLADDNRALVSASSDVTVKVWRPNAADGAPSQAIGTHSDYVKCLASPSPSASWVASGGLDRKINLWDMNGAGQALEISVGEDETPTAKGSVYALAATNNVLASGGPESIVRVWDARTAKRVTKFVGHTDNIRAVLIAQDGDIIMTGSADQTVKVWSMTAGRCMYTLTMHNDSVWSLHSDHPRLSVFHSSDRSGLVAKTDARGCAELDEGLSVAVCQEHGGVSKVVAAGDHVWTATSSSSINRWADIDTEMEVAMPEAAVRWQRNSIATTRSRIPSPPQASHGQNGSNPQNAQTATQRQIPFRCVLRISHTSPWGLFTPGREETSTLYSAAASMRNPSQVLTEADTGIVVPFRSLPEFSIEGQNGLMKHALLNDRRRVLTLDTAGEVILWDLLQCMPIKSFGKRHLEDVLPEVNTMEAVAHWCAVDTRVGSLSIVLEEQFCFDAEMYADEVEGAEGIEFREDQRINLGKWILRYLFANLIDEEIKRDEVFRTNLLEERTQGIQRANAPGSIKLPPAVLNSWTHTGPGSGSTLRPMNGWQLPAATPGLQIGVATPGPQVAALTHVNSHSVLTPTAEEGTPGTAAPVDQTFTQHSHSRSSSDNRGSDYFSAPPGPAGRAVVTPGGNSSKNIVPGSGSSEDGVPPGSPTNESTEPAAPQTPATGEKKGMFGKKFSMNFSMSKLTKTKSNAENAAGGKANLASTAEEVARNSDSDSHSRHSNPSDSGTPTNNRAIEDNFFGTVQRIRLNYADQLTHQPQWDKLESLIQPSLPNDTPVLKLPPNTTILIQEDKAEGGGVVDIFEGTIGGLATEPTMVDLVERMGPGWLGECILRNQLPMKDIVKVSFVLEPWGGQLPSIASDGNNRLNANRMLRARKIMAYVAERIEPAPKEGEEVMRAEEYLELWCQDKKISPTTTLATIRAHIWRGGGDVVLYYKSNGRKEIRELSPAELKMVSGE
ncbi:WD40 repeat-like protein [Aulographum hederae CBS 113979]|uniref:WD40 repeat-like protein n=1 Tax=Aulographum hederae CBS 113979 TaxID=1176131 RepID=A0A6G1GIL4_9PEZI|nr:WD40 repeat-like protein [Aulographum hederae CBS 113979]